MVVVTTGALALAVAGALLLVAAGIGHLRHARALRTALRAQRLLPARLQGSIAVATIAAELVIGPAVPITSLTAPAVAGWPLAAQAALFAAFAAYLSVVRLRRPAAPCGCFGGGEPVTWLAVARAGLLAAGAAAALAGPGLGALPPPDRLVCLAAGSMLAATLWLLPALATGHTAAPTTAPDRATAPGRDATPAGRS